jgi:hypothetical protein
MVIATVEGQNEGQELWAPAGWLASGEFGGGGVCLL